jgi:lipopolysaccharide biosynthesis protein
MLAPFAEQDVSDGPFTMFEATHPAPRSDVNSDPGSVRVVAFYLPQFHPTPENDRWWGKGFTEWTNVTKASPLFEGHYQPHLPTDLGFYDLRLRQTRRDQITMAKQHGIDAFCYHYYWFSGERLLHEPLDDMLQDPGSDMPFCLCWANESWTRRWDAADHEVLIAQKYLPEDDLRFIQDLLPFLRDPRYLLVDGRPLLIVYRPQHLPDARVSVGIWRAHCREAGLGEIHVCAALTHGNEGYEQYGFDSGVEFPPHNMRCQTVNAQINFYAAFSGYVVQYADVANAFLQRTYPLGARVFKTVFPSWDNTARTGSRAVVVLNGTPGNFAQWLSSTMGLARSNPTQGEKLVFINAWNEWAEGCHLEPDRRYGNAFLRATLQARNGMGMADGFPDQGMPNAVQLRRTLLTDLLLVLRYHAANSLGKLRNWANRYPRLRALLVSVMRAAKRLWR